MGQRHHSIGDSGGASQSHATVGRDGRAELSPCFSDHGASAREVTMIPQLTRHKIQVLLQGGPLPG